MILMLLAALAALLVTIFSASQWLSLPPSPMMITQQEAEIVGRMGLMFVGCIVLFLMGAGSEKE